MKAAAAAATNTSKSPLTIPIINNNHPMSLHGVKYLCCRTL